MTNNDFFKLFEDYNNRNYCKGTSYARNCIVKNHFLPSNGTAEVSATTYMDINDAYNAMELSGLAQNTVFGAYAALMKYFKFAIESGEIDTNPVSDARKIRPMLKTDNR